jgi:hypothetical protein
MILFAAGSTQKKYKRVGELILPAQGNLPDSLILRPGLWAMDNGAYSGFDVEAFMRMLQRFDGRLGCRFVCAPDVVGDCYATLQRWSFWSRVIRGIGFPPALVAQDGLTVDDVPWRELAALFIGGTTEWKLGPQAGSLAAYAKSRGLWVHWGRVNSHERIAHIARMGADSFDGSQHNWFPDTKIPPTLDSIDQMRTQGRLV